MTVLASKQLRNMPTALPEPPAAAREVRGNRPATAEDLRLLRAYRRRHNLTQMEVARAAGMDHSRVSFIETGQAPATKAKIRRLRQAIRDIIARRTGAVA